MRTIGNEMSFSDSKINNTDEKVDENCIEIFSGVFTIVSKILEYGSHAYSRLLYFLKSKLIYLTSYTYLRQCAVTPSVAAGNVLERRCFCSFMWFLSAT